MAACLNESGAGELIVDSIAGLTGSQINHYLVLAIIGILASLMANLISTSSSPNAMTLTGGYRFVDYVKVGGLLNVITLIVTLIIFPIFLPI